MPLMPELHPFLLLPRKTTPLEELIVVFDLFTLDDPLCPTRKYPLKEETEKTNIPTLEELLIPEE